MKLEYWSEHMLTKTLSCGWLDVIFIFIFFFFKYTYVFSMCIWILKTQAYAEAEKSLIEILIGEKEKGTNKWKYMQEQTSSLSYNTKRHAQHS